jgi:hypothetical protein
MFQLAGLSMRDVAVLLRTASGLELGNKRPGTQSIHHETDWPAVEFFHKKSKVNRTGCIHENQTNRSAIPFFRWICKIPTK